MGRDARLNLIRFHGVLAPNAKWRAAIIPNTRENETNCSDDANEAPPSAPGRIRLARLLKRVFDIDIEHCPHCGGSLTIIAAIVDPGVIAKILRSLGLPTRAPPRFPAQTLDFVQTA